MAERNIKGVIFDMDGVLLDSEPFINRAIISVFSKLGADVSEKSIIKFLGTGEDNCIAGLCKEYNCKFSDTLKPEIYNTYVKIADGVLRPFDGVLDALDYLKMNDVPFAVASSADNIKVKANLKALGSYASFFTAVITGSMIKNKKPAPDCFLTAAKAISVEPSNCVIVEDALSGILAGRNAGMTTIALATSNKKSVMKTADPDYLIDNPKGLVPLFKKIFEEGAN